MRHKYAVFFSYQILRVSVDKTSLAGQHTRIPPYSHANESFSKKNRSRENGRKERIGQNEKQQSQRRKMLTIWKIQIKYHKW